MLHTKLYPFQAEDVRRIHEFGGRCLLASEMGLGKSLMALYYAWKYLPEDSTGPIVIVCPASIKYHWQREAAKHLSLRAEVLDGEVVPDYGLPGNENGIFVLNYDILTAARRDGRNVPRNRTWAHALNKMKPRLVIADECHAIKNNRAARTKALRRLCKDVNRVLLLSGTPLTNKPTDLWPALNILHPAEYPAFFSFAQTFTNPWKAPWGWVYRGVKNLDRLHRELSSTIMIRRLKADVLHDLPTKTRSVIPIPIPQREYRRAESDFIGWLETVDPGAARRARNAAEITQMNELKRLAGRLKIPGVITWIRDFLESSEQKLLVGAIHKKVTYPLVEAFADAGAILVDGDCNDKQKTAAFDKFNNDPNCRVMVGNILAAGVGWSCKSTSRVAIVELPWAPGECVQFEDRCHGIGRGQAGVPVDAYYLVASDSIESDLCDVLETKSGWLSQTLDGGARADDLDVHKQVLELLKRRTEK